MDQDELGGVGRWRTFALIAMAVAGAATLVLLIVTLGHANHERDRALDLQSRSYDVMILARTLAGTIARSEASLGRYVISGDQALGQLYFEDWRRAGENITRLDKLTRDNKGQHDRLDVLRRAYQERGAELALGAYIDPIFGPAVMVATGGIFLELGASTLTAATMSPGANFAAKSYMRAVETEYHDEPLTMADMASDLGTSAFSSFAVTPFFAPMVKRFGRTDG